MPRLLCMIELVWNLTEPIQSMKHPTDAPRNQLHAQHSTMLQAFTSRGSSQMLAAARSHFDDLEAVVAELPTENGLFTK